MRSCPQEEPQQILKKAQFFGHFFGTNSFTTYHPNPKAGIGCEINCPVLEVKKTYLGRFGSQATAYINFVLESKQHKNQVGFNLNITGLWGCINKAIVFQKKTLLRFADRNLGVAPCEGILLGNPVRSVSRSLEKPNSHENRRYETPLQGACIFSCLWLCTSCNLSSRFKVGQIPQQGVKLQNSGVWSQKGGGEVAKRGQWGGNWKVQIWFYDFP